MGGKQDGRGGPSRGIAQHWREEPRRTPGVTSLQRTLRGRQRGIRGHCASQRCVTAGKRNVAIRISSRAITAADRDRRQR